MSDIQNYEVYYVLHSPYKDNSWRGIEKCVGTEKSSAPLLFSTFEEANEFKINSFEEDANNYIIVEVKLSYPMIREKIKLNMQGMLEDVV